LDHSTIVRRWAISLMSGLPGFEIIGGAQDPHKAIGQLMRQKPDVLIMDERMQRELGIDILQSIRDLTPPPMVIMLTNKVFNRLQQKVTDVKADFPSMNVTNGIRSLRSYTSSGRGKRRIPLSFSHEEL